MLHAFYWQTHKQDYDTDKRQQGRLGGLFDAQQLLTDVSGSGNNWAHGHHLYGPQYRDNLLDSIRRPVEACESLQSFLLLQSLGGGTGSGLGCYILNLLEVGDCY